VQVFRRIVECQEKQPILPREFCALQNAAYSGPTIIFFLVIFITFKYINFLTNIMAKDNKISMPSGSGGLTRYFDEFKSNITIQPGHVVVICVTVIVLMILLYVWGANIF